MKRKFTPRDSDIVDCLFSGLNHKEAATKLGIRERSVKKHVARIAHLLKIEARWLLRVRIVYVLSIERGIIKPFAPLGEHAGL